MEQELKVKGIAKYNGHNVKVNKSIDLGLKFTYDELKNYIKLIQLLNENVKIKVKIGSNETKMLGTFMIKEIKIDHDGEGVIKFNSMIDYAELNEITSLIGIEQFKVLFSANVTIDDEVGA